MPAKLWIALVVGVVLLHGTGSAAWPAASEDDLARRRALAESGVRLASPVPLKASAVFTVSELTEALDLDPANVVDVTTTGPAAAVGIFTGLGAIRPRQGETLLLISTGQAGSLTPEPGTDFAPGGVEEGDRATVRITLSVPPGVTRLSFDFQFLSTEYPDFVGTQFNDTFSAILTDTSGVREVARSSVNSAAFFPVSADNAGGSGFDLFTADPSGVDADFGSGLPDAGLTGWQTASVPITGSTITIEFAIQDLGDGILDSTVLIDRIVLSGIEFLDPNPALLTNGDVTSDPALLATAGDRVQAAAADGVTRVVLRSQVTGPGQVEFCLSGGTAPQDGGLGLAGQGGFATCAPPTTVQQVQGKHVAFAVYRAPDNFARPGDEPLAKRAITFSAQFTPAIGNPTTTLASLDLVRPPLVLLHGLWSGPGSWDYPIMTDERFRVTLGNYQSTHGASFATNAFAPAHAIVEALIGFRLERTAATQVDMVGHSMGGILSRNHTALPGYKNNANFQAGDLHKLITLNTPHTGSPLANVLVGLRGPVGNFLLDPVLGFLEGSLADQALDDLSVGSSAILAISTTPVPGHAIVGTGGSTLLELAPGWIGSLYTAIDLLADVSDLFQTFQHDLIVGRQSQEGGMPGSAMTVFNGLDSIHFGVAPLIGATHSLNYSSRLTTLLDTPVGSSSFAQFPAPGTLSVHVPTGAKIRVPVAAPSPGLTITSPANGTPVQPGVALPVTVVAGPGIPVNRVVLVGAGLAYDQTGPPFQFAATIPVDVVGPFTLSAVGTDGAGNYFTSNQVTLQVMPASPLTGITLAQRRLILFTAGEQRRVTVIGQFGDGVRRDVSAAATGTTYATSEPTIATVDADGLLTAVAPGITTLVVNNGSFQDSTNVTVFQANRVPIADAGPDQTALVNTLIALDGSASSDSDSGPTPLTFAWLQVAGAPVSLSGATTSAPQFLPAGGGQYTFSLVVNDGHSDSPPDSVTVKVASFSDVTPGQAFWPWIEALLRAGITGGCAITPPQYCPGVPVTRAQMAVFLLRGIHGAGYDPPAPTGTVFADVPGTHPFVKWIEELAHEGITGGCSASPPRYCPEAGITRGQMAVFLLRAKHGPGYDPPAATGTMFADVPGTHPFAKWIEQLAHEGITGGCSANPPQYCPNATITRGQMAVFLVRAFNLPM